MHIEIDAGPYALRGLGRINFIVGKNGAGKSTLMKAVEEHVRTRGTYGRTQYVTPERGGNLRYEAGIENNIVGNELWLGDSRRRNQFNQFREQSVAQYRRLELLVLKELEHDVTLRADLSHTFDTYVSKINSLLDNVEIRRSGSAFKMWSKRIDQELVAEQISSGEAELISLGIECLMFEKECIAGRENLMFLDSPDAHLHPDLQDRFAKFLAEIAAKGTCRFIVATHSTSLIAAAASSTEHTLTLMTAGQRDLRFNAITQTHKKILPMFGAHPLSNVFNASPILLLEGEDDERIWQQAIRSSQGKIRLYPCDVGGSANLREYESEVRAVIQSVYDRGVAFSLRDRDDAPELIDNDGPVIRMRLACRAAENLLLSDDVLARLGLTWNEFRARIELWLERNVEHVHAQRMKEFRDGGYDRIDFDLKLLRNDLMGIAGSNKTWEVLVGQVIGVGFACLPDPPVTSLQAFLGEKVVRHLIQGSRVNSCQR